MSLQQGAVVPEARHSWALFAKVAVVVGLLMLGTLTVARVVTMVAADLAEHVVARIGLATKGRRCYVPVWSSSVEAAVLPRHWVQRHWRCCVDESIAERRVRARQRWNLRRHRGLRRREGGRLRGGLHALKSGASSSLSIRLALAGRCTLVRALGTTSTLRSLALLGFT